MKSQALFSIRLIGAVLILTIAALVPVTLAASGQIPPGAYSATVTAADIPPDFPPEFAAILIGSWTVEFNGDGTTEAYKNGELVAFGRYTTNKSHLVMTDTGGPLACLDAKGIATGVYTWQMSGGQLTLSPVLDRCFGRQFVLTLRPLEQE